MLGILFAAGVVVAIVAYLNRARILAALMAKPTPAPTAVPVVPSGGAVPAAQAASTVKQS